MEEKFRKGINELGLSIPEPVQQTLLDFLVFLQKWNKAYNLTSVKGLENMVTQHLLDSLSIIPYLKGKTILDVGSGGGFPGIPVALACPDKQLTLLDSKNKKTAFLLQAAYRFKINNVTVVQSRVLSYRPAFCFDTIICRAFGSIKLIMEQTQHLLGLTGKWFIMKGTYPYAELVEVKYPVTVHNLTVPGLKAERHLVEIENDRNCDS